MFDVESSADDFRPERGNYVSGWNVGDLAKLALNQCQDLVIWHRGPQILDVNEYVCRTLGYSYDELIQLELDDIDRTMPAILLSGNVDDVSDILLDELRVSGKLQKPCTGAQLSAAVAAALGQA